MPDRADKSRSFVTIPMEELQEIVNQYAGTGFIPEDEEGNWKHKEVVTLPIKLAFM